MEKLATIKVLKLLDKNQRKLTFLQTPYLYADIEIVFFAEYHSKEQVYYHESIKVKDIEISRSNHDMALKGSVFIVETESISNEGKFTDFSKKLDKPEIIPFYQDSYLLDYKEELRVLDLQLPEETINLEKDKNAIELRNSNFLSEFKRDNNLIEELSNFFIHSQMYYDIYDVNGYFSVITNDKDFDFYIDMGDISNNSISINKTPYCVFISHYHFDHFNILQQSKINAKNYILPYSGSIIFNGIQHYPANEIRILINNPRKTHLLFSSTGIKKGRNKLKKVNLIKNMNLYIPYYLKPNDRNLESICVEIIGENNTVFYPGDTMNYMYFPFLKNFDYFIASHHGGNVGKLNLKSIIFNNLVVNTYYKNVNLYLSKYKLDYINHTHNFIEGNSNNGQRIVRIKL